MTRWPVRPGILALAILAAALVGGWVAAWYKPSPKAILVRPAPIPYRAEVASWIEKEAVERIVTRTVVVQEPRDEEAAEELEERFGERFDVLRDDILAVVDVEPLPHGGEAAVTLTPEGRTEVFIAPSKSPFFEALLRERQVELGYGTTFAARYRQGLARLGPLELSVEVGALGDQGGYAVVLAGTRF